MNNQIFTAHDSGFEEAYGNLLDEVDGVMGRQIEAVLVLFDPVEGKVKTISTMSPEITTFVLEMTQSRMRDNSPINVEL